MDYARAFSPGHVTGFFSVVPHSDPLRQGSLGAGFSVTGGVTTEISLADRDQFYLNEVPLSSHSVSYHVLKLFRERTSQTQAWTVRHSTNLPVGCGFGTSGAGALSLALALNAAYRSPLSMTQAASLAHLAEIICKTGLGTVIGEFHGDFEIRVEAGSPGIGTIQKLPTTTDLKAIFFVQGPISTAQMLNNTTRNAQNSQIGEALRQQLLRNPTVENFLKLSLQFDQDTQLVPPELQRWQSSLAQRGILAPMLMFGNGLFTLADSSNLATTLEVFQKEGKNGHVFSYEIDRLGGRVLDVY